MLTTTRRAALISGLATTGLAAFGNRALAQETGAVGAAVDKFAQEVMAAFPDQPGLGITVVENGQITLDRKSTRLNPSHRLTSRMPSSA
jgi:CubicO group peptidase (beta-lactamase class C family)